jgi:hypothetical protein
VSDIVYISKSRIERREGPLRIAYLPGESQPVVYSVHGAIAEHYKIDPEKSRNCLRSDRVASLRFELRRRRNTNGEQASPFQLHNSQLTWYSRPRICSSGAQL